jgi:hypothetical protein
MKDCSGKELKVGDSVKFVCTINDLADAGIAEDHGKIILNSIGKIFKSTQHEDVIEIYVKELEIVDYSNNYRFFDNMIELI